MAACLHSEGVPSEAILEDDADPDTMQTADTSLRWWDRNRAWSS